MKKFIKWFIFWTIIIGGISLAICYMTIPEQTKSAADIVVGYLNTPLGIAGGTTITLGVVLYIVIKNVGKYLFNKNRNELEEYKEKVQELVDKAKNYEEIAKEHYDELVNKINELKDIQENDFISLLENLVLVCSTSPNAKIKKIGVQLKEILDNYGTREETND